MKNIYHYHIPKTAGRYITDSVILSLNYAFKKNNINTRNTLKSEHNGWSLVDEESFLFTFIRKPVDRTISHVLFYNPMLARDTTENVKINVLNYLEKDTSAFLDNYQTKFICSVDSDMENKFHESFEYDLLLKNERISRFNFLHKTDTITDITLSEIYNMCCDYMDLSHERSTKIPFKLSWPEELSEQYWSSEISKQIRESLSQSERSFIESKNELDMDLYESIIQ